MSVIQRIRDKGAWIIFAIIALALIAFILQDGVSRGRSGIFSNTSTVGKVNGKTITREEFEAKLQLYSGNGQDRNSLIPQLWNQEVNLIILHQEYDKLGLTVTGKELSDLLFSPSSPIAREFTNPETGVFDEAAARKAVDALKKSKDQKQLENIMEAAINPMIEQALNTKYTDLVKHAAYAPAWLVEKQIAENKAISSFSYVSVPYGTIADSTVKVSDDEIMAYVKKHPQGFERDEESRTFSYISFDANPSAADTADVLNALNIDKDGFATTTDVKDFLAKHPSEFRNYEGYLGQKQIQQPVKDSLFKLSAGQTYGPYLDGNNYVIAKMIGARSIPDTVKVRHILVATHEKSQATGGVLMRSREDSSAKKTMDSVVNFIAAGASWDSICKKYSDDGNSKDKGGVYDNIIANGGMVPEFNDFAFTAGVGQKGVVKTEYGYHYIEVLSQKGSQTGYKIAYLAKPIKASSNTINDAFAAAQQFAGTVKDKKQFEEAAAKLNKPVMVGGDVKQTDYNVSVFGNQGSARQFVHWLYDNKEGTVSEPNDLGNKYVVAIITGVTPKGLPAAAQARPQAEPFVRNEKKAKQIIETKFKGSGLEAYAASAGVGVQRADSVAFNAPFVLGLGSEPKVIGAAFNKSLVGKASEPIVGNSGVIAIKVDAIGQKETPTADAEAVKNSILQAIGNNVYGGIEALKKKASIKDNRYSLNY